MVSIPKHQLYEYNFRTHSTWSDYLDILIILELASALQAVKSSARIITCSNKPTVSKHGKAKLGSYVGAWYAEHNAMDHIYGNSLDICGLKWFRRPLR